MLLYVAGEFRVPDGYQHHGPRANSFLSYVVMRDLLSIELSTSSKSRLVTIPEKCVVQLPCSSSLTPFVELTWQGKDYLIFEIDRSRLKPNRDTINERPQRRRRQTPLLIRTRERLLASPLD
jgi:hypothetical protein